MANLRNWMQDLLGVQYVYANGVLQPSRAAIDFRGATGADNPSTGRTEISFSNEIHAAVDPGFTGTANTAALNAAITAVTTLGGGTVRIPPGSFPVSGEVTLPSVPCTIRGAGMGLTVLDWENTAHLFNTGIDARHTAEYLAIEDLTIEGKWSVYQDETPAVTPIIVYGRDNVRMQRVEVRNCTFFGFVLRNCERVLVTECQVFEVAKDGISCATCTYVQITDNRIDHCDDDAITVHIEAAASESTKQGVVISNNRIADAQGIVAIGLRHGVISGNQIERCRLRGILVGSPVAYDRTVSHSIVISGNTITDIFNRDTIDGLSNANDYIIVESRPQQGTGVAVPGLPNSSGVFEPIDQSLDNLGSGDPYPPSTWITITGNTLARTLPLGVSYSAYGHGNMFTRTGYLNPTVTAAMLSTSAIGVRLTGGLRDSVIADNEVRGLSGGVVLAGATNDWEQIAIRGNSFVRLLNGGVVFDSSVTGGRNITISDNLIDGDPYHEHANRGSNGTWQALGLPAGVLIQNAAGVVVRDNQFRRLCRVTDKITSATEQALHIDNLWDCVPSAVGFSTSNSGIGEIPTSGIRGTARIVTDVPTSPASYGFTANVCQFDSSTMPSTGTYPAGHFVRSLVAGGVLGWRRLTTGSAHVLGTDWQEVGAPAANVQEFTGSGTWNKLAGAKKVLVQLLGAGGGSGGGARVTSGNACSGGAGGGAGALIERWFDASELGTTETVTLGAAGTAGAGATADNTAGGDGGGGGNSTFGSIITAFGGGGGAGGELAGASGGGGSAGALGAGGNATGTTGGAAGSVGGVAGASGAGGAPNTNFGCGSGSGGGVNGAAGPANGACLYGSTGGAAGGGISVTPTAFAGGNAFAPPHSGQSNPVGGAATGAAGGNATTPKGVPGGGGAGGGGNTAGAGGAGGLPARGGGAGGGGSAIGGNGGAGQAGGAAYCRVTTWF